MNETPRSSARRHHGNRDPASFSATDVSVRFGRICALEAVTVDAARGGVTCVVGGDGAGKSTLLKVLCGATGRASGDVRLPEPRRIGYLPPGSGVYGDLSVEENLAFSASVYGIDRPSSRRLIEEALRHAGLERARRRLVAQLSGGMRQKLGVVRAMLHRPELLVLDEPTTGVDPVSRAELWRLIARAAADGAAVVVATTAVDEAERAENVVLLDAGHQLVSGSPADIVGAVPGVIHRLPARPAGAGERCWRRGTAWRMWSDTTADVPVGATPIVPDLHDAVVVAGLARREAGSTSSTGLR